MWQPGGFNSWLTVPRYGGTLPVNFHPLVAPGGGAVKTVVVGRGAAISAFPTSQLVLRAGSAGMGIPRGSLEGLNHLNHQVAKTGSAEVHSAPAFATSSSRSMSPSGYSAQRSSMASAPAHSSASSGHASGGSHH